LIAAGALYSVGAPVFINRIEADLERRVPDELADAGHQGVLADFSGQDGTLYCRAALSDPEAAGEIAYDVWGVRTITVDRSCRVNRSTPAQPAAGESGSGSASATDAPPLATTASVEAGDADAEVDRALTGDGPATATQDRPGRVMAAIAVGTVSLTGVVGSEVERARLLE
jgi:hypothetical protein